MTPDNSAPRTADVDPDELLDPIRSDRLGIVSISPFSCLGGNYN